MVNVLYSSAFHDIAYLSMQEVRLTQLEPAYPEEGETGSGDESGSGEMGENTSTPTEEDNQSDEQEENVEEKESEEDNEFEQAFGSGEDDDND